MHRLWPVVEELLRVTGARRVCEIGADDGQHTRRLIAYCADKGAFLEVIDPEPKFDVETWLAASPGIWRLHSQASLSALRDIAPCDVYLIDGDHNWFTVTSELRLIRERASGTLPLVVLHDTSWPYARRDLYYTPERIPEPFRLPYARGALQPGTVGLCERGLNGHLCNALEEGGSRNGVLSAIEDHLSETADELVAVHLPMWFGLTLLVPRQRLAAGSPLARFVEKLRGLSEFGVVAELERERIALLVAHEVTAPRPGANPALAVERAARGRLELELRKAEIELAHWRAQGAHAGEEEWLRAPPAREAFVKQASGRREIRVDVVVTVHEALADVERCLAALRRHTDDFDVRVIVVDDGSCAATNERLRAHAAAWPRLTVTTHGTNLGYTLAANTGLAATNAPWVVILNSDTLVTAGWLARMVRCAESDPAIGLVGPLSNAASWQSVPAVKDSSGAFAVNTLGPWLDVDAMAELVAGVPFPAYPRVAVLNGFCILLRREVVERLGYMDVSAFPFGYGEENDYCLRARDAGFALAVACDAFVYHAKSRSFGHAARVELSRRGAEALLAKHGTARVERLNQDMENNQELNAVRLAVQEKLRTRGGELGDPFGLRILFLLPAHGLSGGASSVIREAAEMARMGVFVRVAVPPERLADLGAAYGDVPGVRELLIAPPLEALLDFAKDFDVAVATVYYTMEWVARIVAATPAVLPAYYVQDYEPLFFAEGSAEVVAAEASYCRQEGAVLFAKSNWLVRTLLERQGVRAVRVSPGLDSATFHPGRRNGLARLRIAAMVRPQTPRRAAPRTMRVLAELARRLGAKLEVHVFGCAETDERFLELERGFQFTCHGVLNRPGVAGLLRSSDVFVDLSDYQAFGRTSLEAMACGCVPVVPRAGGSTEFARDGANALVVDTSDELGCVEKLETLLCAPARLDLMRRSALATATQFSVRRAAVSELYVMADAARARRVTPPTLARGRLVLARLLAPQTPVWVSSSVLGGWKLPSVHRAWRISEIEGLPVPGSADVAVLVLDPQLLAWDLVELWLQRWRAVGGRVIAHVGFWPESSSAGGRALSGLRWLASACDGVAASSTDLVSRLALGGIAAELLPQALDPITWRLGPAARRLAERAAEDPPIRIGLLGDAPSAGLNATLQAAGKDLLLAYGDRIAIESLDAKTFKLGQRLRAAPKSSTEAAWLDWAFHDASWDIALVPFLDSAEISTDERARFLASAALGAAMVVSPVDVDGQLGAATSWCRVVGNSATAWRDAVGELIEDAASRARLSETARAGLDARHGKLDEQRVAVRLLARVYASARSADVPLLPAALRTLPRSLVGPLLSRYVAVGPAGTAVFPAPRSKLRRKLAKLRRNPAAFFRDAKLKPLRLLRGLFD